MKPQIAREGREEPDPRKVKVPHQLLAKYHNYGFLIDGSNGRMTKATLYYTPRSTSLNMHRLHGIHPHAAASFTRLTGNSVKEHTQLLYVYIFVALLCLTETITRMVSIQFYYCNISCMY